MSRPAGLALLLVLWLVAMVVGLGREWQRRQALGDGPEQALGQVERCLRCHDGAKDDPGGAHSALALGCSSCHLGDPLSYDAARAHAGMEPEPGALETVDRTCAQAGCHAREAARVRISAMTTAAGIISADRLVFGESALGRPETMAAVLAEPQPTPAETHVRRLCAGCHLGARKGNKDDAIVTRGSGCSACHLGSQTGRHPSVGGPVGDDRCLGCHSRSGRVSLSYTGLAELQATDMANCATPAQLHDGRPACRLEADVHQRAGMACIDCHLHSEVMGDGRQIKHKAEQLEVRCESCHGPVDATLQATWDAVNDPISADLLRINGQTRPKTEPVRRGRRGTPLWNLRNLRNLRPTQAAGSGLKAPWTLSRKADGQPLPVRQTPADNNHRLPGHERLGCATCHSAWMPTCSSCHVSWRDDGKQWDFALAAEAPGRWQERAVGLGWGPPTLAVVADKDIVPATPGMIMELQTAAGGSVRSARLYAPLVPHTTGSKARTCAGCHLSSVVIGLGRGQLHLDGPAPRFVAAQPDAATPGRGRDGWVALQATEVGQSTREHVRSLNRAERLRVLAVGTCLPCHGAADDAIYRDFPRSLTALVTSPAACKLEPPQWLRDLPASP